MYDINKRKKLLDVTVGDLIAELQEYPEDAAICCCGESIIYIHVDKNESNIVIDTEDLDDDYIDDPDTDPDEYWENREKYE